MAQLRIKKLLHVSLLVADIRVALEFYCGVLGFTVSDKRPSMSYPGVWFEFGGQQLHLMELTNPDPVSGRPQHPGRDRHVAFMVNDLDTLTQRLREHDIAYSLSHSGRRALFTRDPDGNGLEFVELKVKRSVTAAAESAAEAGADNGLDMHTDSEQPGTKDSQ